MGVELDAPGLFLFTRNYRHGSASSARFRRCRQKSDFLSDRQVHKMKVCLIGMTPDHQIRERSLLLAPYILKRYAENYVTPKGIVDIEVMDFPFNADPEKMASDISGKRPAIVGLSFYVWNFNSLIKCSQFLKQVLPKVIILGGGPSITFNAEEVMQANPQIDVVSFDNRRGEIIFTDFMQCFANHKSFADVKGIVYRSKENLLKKTAPPEGVVDLSANVSPYINNDILLNEEKGHYVILETYRGCPFDCGYCCWGGQRCKVEFVPMDRLKEEIRIIYNNPNVKYVLFTDANILLNKKRAIEIIRHIEKQSQYKKIQNIMTINIASIDPKSAKMLSKLPGFEFGFGLQTVNPVSLDLISKNRTKPGVFKEKLDAIKKELPDIECSIDIMLGLPGDTLGAYKKTLDFCFSMEPSNISIAYPIYLLPGSRFYRDKDILNLNYTSDHPKRILSTKDFPEQDIDEATNLSIWIQILIKYYPAISKFFYYLCRGKKAGERIALMEYWVDQIDALVHLFHATNIRKAAEISFEQWNKEKTQRLKHAAFANEAYKIYSVIHSLHKNDPSDIFDRTINLGLSIFSYYKDNNINAIGLTAMDLVPESYYQTYSKKDIKNVHSKFKV